jgi:hypothetical protein
MELVALEAREAGRVAARRGVLVAFIGGCAMTAWLTGMAGLIGWIATVLTPATCCDKAPICCCSAAIACASCIPMASCAIGSSRSSGSSASGISPCCVCIACMERISVSAWNFATSMAVSACSSASFSAISRSLSPSSAVLIWSSCALI